MNKYTLTFTTADGGGQFTERRFDIEATDDPTAIIVANDKMAEYNCLMHMASLVRVDGETETQIAKA